MLARWLVSRDRKGQNLGINACSMAYESRPRSCNSPGSTCRDQCQPTGLGGGTSRNQETMDYTAEGSMPAHRPRRWDRRTLPQGNQLGRLTMPAHRLKSLSG